MGKLITKEIQSKAEELIKSCEYNIKSYEYLYKPCVYVGSIRVYGTGAESYIYLDEDLGKEYIREWKKDVGQVLLNCFKRNQIDRLFEISDNNIKFLLYRIGEDEYESFKENGFDHLTIGDMHYTIIRCSHTDQPFNWKDVTFVREVLPEKEETSDDTEDDYKLEEEPEPESFSLFD